MAVWPDRGLTPWDDDLKAYLDEREQAVLDQVASDINDPDSAIGSLLAASFARRAPAEFVGSTNLQRNPFFNTDLSGWSDLLGDSNNKVDRVASRTWAYPADIPDYGFAYQSGGSLARISDPDSSAAHKFEGSPVAVDRSRRHLFDASLRRSSGGSSSTIIQIQCFNAAAGVADNINLMFGTDIPAVWTRYNYVIDPEDWPAATVAADAVFYGNFGPTGAVDLTHIEWVDADYGSFTSHAVGTHEMYVDEDGYLYAMNHNAGSISKIDPATGHLIWESVLTGAEYLHDITSDGTYLWTVAYYDNKVFKVNQSTGELVATYTIAGPSAHAYGVNYFAGSIWVGSGDGANSRLTKVDPADGTMTSYNIGALSITGNIPVIDDGTYLWVGSEVNKCLYKVDPLTGGVVQTVAIPVWVYGLGFDGTYIYAGGHGASIGGIDGKGTQVIRLLASTGEIVSRHMLPYAVETNWKYDGGRYIYAAGAFPIGDPSECALIRWDVVDDSLTTISAPYGRQKAVAVVKEGREVWTCSYYHRSRLVFATG